MSLFEVMRKGSMSVSDELPKVDLQSLTCAARVKYDSWWRETEEGRRKRDTSAKADHI